MLEWPTPVNSDLSEKANWHYLWSDNNSTLNSGSLVVDTTKYGKICLVSRNIEMFINCTFPAGTQVVQGLTTGCPVMLDAGVAGFHPGIRYIRFDWYPDHLYIHTLFDYDLTDGASYSAGRYLNSVVGIVEEQYA